MNETETPFNHYCPLCGAANESIYELPQRCHKCDVMIYDEDLDEFHPFLWTDDVMDALNYNNITDSYEGEAYIDQ